MAKHFISPDWKSLRKLPEHLQRAWFYMWDHCDAAGVYEFDEEYMKLDLSLRQAISKLELTKCPDVIILPTGQLFLKNFIEINYGTLKTDYNPHKPIFRSIEKYNLSSLMQASFKLEDEDEDEGKEEEEGEGEDLGKGGEGGKPFLPKTENPKKQRARPRAAKPVSLEDWGRREDFDRALPDWEPERRDHYWAALENYSNKGNQYKNWAATAKAWARNDAAKGNLTPWKQQKTGPTGRPQTETPTQTDDITRIIDEFNALTQSQYDKTDDAIRGYLAGRLMDGCQLQDMLDVIALKAVQWGSGDERKFLKFQTLFKPQNYPGYVQEVRDAKAGKIKVLNPNESRYDRIQRKIDAALGRT